MSTHKTTRNHKQKQKKIDELKGFKFENIG